MEGTSEASLLGAQLQVYEPWAYGHLTVQVSSRQIWMYGTDVETIQISRLANLKMIDLSRWLVGSRLALQV
jgi:hypothetical protein